jgi:hypothetical protein
LVASLEDRKDEMLELKTRYEKEIWLQEIVENETPMNTQQILDVFSSDHDLLLNAFSEEVNLEMTTTLREIMRSVIFNNLLEEARTWLDGLEYDKPESKEVNNCYTTPQLN